MSSPRKRVSSKQTTPFGRRLGVAVMVMSVLALLAAGAAVGRSPRPSAAGTAPAGMTQLAAETASPASRLDELDAGQPGAAEPTLDVVLWNAHGRELGRATFTEMSNGSVVFSVVTTQGLQPGEHGIHVHEIGDCDPTSRPRFFSAGRHYNPEGVRHGGPPSGDADESGGHAGDLGNVQVDDSGRGELRLTTARFELADLRDVDGSALVIHRNRDDLVSNPEGGSGPRIACGVIFAPSPMPDPVATPGVATPVAGQVADGPNVVLILVDDLDTRTFETALPRLPHLRALQNEGVTFENFIISTPLCCPSRASILRGQYAHNHGVLSNLEPLGGFAVFNELDREESTIATWLDDAGYQTALIGKYLNRYPLGAGYAYVPPAGTSGWSP